MIEIDEQTPKSYSFPTQCKLCGSTRIVRYGYYMSIQRWFCKACNRKFVQNDAPPKMRTPAVQIASALSMFYEGMSLNTIRRHLEQAFHNFPSDSTVYDWVIRFTKTAVATEGAHNAKSTRNIDELGHGPFWIANATPLNIEGEKFWLWDVIDYWNRLLVASRFSSTRTVQDVKTAMELAAQRAGEAPGLVITGKLGTFREGIELAFGADSHHLQAKDSKVQPYLNTIDRFHGALKTRNRIIRSLKRRKTVELITAGWLVHYNFFRPHEALRYNTPASIAGMDFPYSNWLDVVKKDIPSYEHREVSPEDRESIPTITENYL